MNKTIAELRATSTKRVSSQVIVYVKGHEVPELSGVRTFPDGENNMNCYTDCLGDIIDTAMDPIHRYLIQMDELLDKETKDMEMMNILFALYAGAKKQIDGALNDIKIHLGDINLKKVTYGNSGTFYRPEDVVAVECQQMGVV